MSDQSIADQLSHMRGLTSEQILRSVYFPIPSSDNDARIKHILALMPKYIPLGAIMITGVPYEGRDKLGDMYWMINRPEYKYSLFIFEVTIDMFLHPNCHIPYMCTHPPRAIGVPVDESLDRVKQYIDTFFSKIHEGLLFKGHYNQVLYTSQKDGKTFRNITYRSSDEVNAYITEKLDRLQQHEFMLA